MIKGKKQLVSFLMIGFLGLSLLSTRWPDAAGATNPISHIIVVMQENHTFDNYFGTYPGANGIPNNVQLPVNMNPGRSQGCSPEPRRQLEPTPGTAYLSLHHLDATRTPDPPHDEKTARLAYDCGHMDGLVYAHDLKNFSSNIATGYYDYRDIPYYWDLAQYYTLTDNFFSSYMGGSFQNHLFLYAAADNPISGSGCPSTSNFYSCIPQGGMDLPVIFDELQSKGVTWKNYVQNYHPEITYTNDNARLGLDKLSSQLIWTPLLGIPRYVSDPTLNSKIQDLKNYFVDLNTPSNPNDPSIGLPSVSFISPSGESEHPPGDIVLGQLFIVNLISALMTSSYWNNSMFILTYDDWGGWYDHVPPPQVDSSGYGFRVPALIISPYAKSGYIDHTQYDFTSILATIESLFGVSALRPNGRDGSANPLWNAFDFNAGPNPPVIPSGQYPQRGVSRAESALIVWLTYAGTIVASGILLYGAVHSRRRGANSWFGSVQVRLL